MDKMVQRRSYFTIVEFLIVMTIIAVIGSVVSININKALKEQRFRAEVGMILDELRLAQDLMLIANADVHLKFQEGKESNKIIYWLDFDYPLPQPWEKEVKRPHENLQAIHVVDFDDFKKDQRTRGQFDIKFLSRGSVVSQGVLKLMSSASGKPLIRYIYLPGYPSPFVSSSERPAEYTFLAEEEKLYNEQLTNFTRQEIAAHKEAVKK